MLNHFWRRWCKEYLSSLREYQRVTSGKRSSKIQVNDIVIIYDENQPRHLWRLGNVEKLITGDDGNSRGAEVKCGKTGVTIRRPVNKLYPLVTNNSTEEKQNRPREIADTVQPKRKAAIIGEIRRKYGTIK